VMVAVTSKQKNQVLPDQDTSSVPSETCHGTGLARPFSEVTMNYKGIKVQGIKRDEHRFVMESFIGRKLSNQEVVHHKDGDILNNKIENLEIMELSEHSRMHMLGKKLSPETRDKLREIGRRTRARAKLSIEQVTEIRKMLDRGVSGCSLAKLYNVDIRTISGIKKYEIWEWIV
jgi:hypothetical protein